MRRMLVAAVVAALLVAAAPAGRTDDSVLKLVRVAVPDARHAASVASAFDETHVYDPGFVHVLLWPGDQARLDALGYRYEVLVDDVVARDRAAFAAAARTAAPVALPGPDRSTYRVLSDYEDEMSALEKDHPNLVRTFTLPHETHEGRTVRGVEIAGDVKRRDGRPVFYVDGVHHAREWPAAEYPMIFAHYLVEGFGKDRDVTRLLTEGRVLIVPIVNPDGFDYSRSALLAQNSLTDTAHGFGCGGVHCEGYWRKNRRSYTGATVPVAKKNPDAYGIDPNRNYSFMWGGAGSTNNPFPVADQTYRGAEPHSEPETRNVQDLLLSRNVTSIITNHTYSRLVLRPWGDTMDDSLDERYLVALGARMAKAMGGYQNIKSRELYVTTGTMSDWGYGTFGVPSYTFEHGTAFHPPYTGCNSDCIEKEWRGVMEAFMIAGEAALDRKVHGVVKGKVTSGGRPVRATLTLSKSFTNPLSKGNPIRKDDWPHKLSITLEAAGAFEWHLPPSTRPHLRAQGKRETYKVTVSAKAGRSRSFTIEVEQGQILDLGIIRL